MQDLIGGVVKIHILIGLRAAMWQVFLLFTPLVLIHPSIAFAVNLYLPDYTATTFGFAAGQGDDLDIDSLGRIYAPGSAQWSGIQRFSSNGSSEMWSTAPGYSLAVSGDGTKAYLATRDTGHSIQKINANGSYINLTPGSSNLGWTWVALSSSGNLYANVWAGTGEGLYSINTTTGAYSAIVSGGPGLNGAGWYGDMAVGLDGKLYANGSDGSGWGLFRLDGSAFSKVATLPNGFFGLTAGPNGLFFTGADSEVWMMDSLTGNASLLASGFLHASGVAYDPLTARLYVRDGDTPYQITAIQTPFSPVPIPAAFWLFGSGVIGILGFMRRRKKNK